MSKEEVDDALDYLCGEGHIFIDIFGGVIDVRGKVVSLYEYVR